MRVSRRGGRRSVLSARSECCRELGPGGIWIMLTWVQPSWLRIRIIWASRGPRGVDPVISEDELGATIGGVVLGCSS